MSGYVGKVIVGELRGERLPPSRCWRAVVDGVSRSTSQEVAFLLHPLWRRVTAPARLTSPVIEG